MCTFVRGKKSSNTQKVSLLKREKKTKKKKAKKKTKKKKAKKKTREWEEGATRTTPKKTKRPTR